MVRASALALVALLLLTSVPSPAQAASTVRIDLDVQLLDAHHVLLAETVTEGSQHFRPWQLPIPENATVLEAHDASGFLSNTSSGGTVTIQTRGSGASYAFTVDFVSTPDVFGGYVRLLGQVSGNQGDPTSVRATLPSGWTLAGVRAPSGLVPDASGVYASTGAFNVEYVALPPGAADPGPDPRAVGAGVFRAADAYVDATGGLLNVTVVYDTDIYSDVSVPVPPGATPLSARTQSGAATYEVTAGGVHIPAAYPFQYGLAGRPVSVAFRLGAPTEFGGAFRNASINMAAGANDNLTLSVRLAPDLVHVGTRTTATTDATGLNMTSREPFVAQVAFLPPKPAGMTDLTIGKTYYVRVPDALADKAAAVAKNASALLPQTSAFAGGARIDHPFFLTYNATESLYSLFSGEEGYYTGGMNTITIRAASLANSTATTAEFGAVSTLVHETTHGLVDRMIPQGFGNLSFFQEGLARLAEQHLETRFPKEVVKCSASSCTRLSVRPEPRDVQSRYQSGWVFPLTWKASNAGPDLGYLYDDSGMILRAYEERAGALALGRALISLAVRGGGPDDATEAAAVVDSLLMQAPHMTEASLLYPGKPVASIALDKFTACMGYQRGDLARPEFDPSTLPSPPANCGDFPTGTTESTDPGPVPPHGENFTLPPPPAPATPTIIPTTSGSPRSVTPVDGVVGGDTTGATGPSGGGKVPSPAIALVVAALVVVAILRRR